MKPPRRYADREALAALVRSMEDMHALEREYAREAISSGSPVVYCGGPGRRTVELRSLGEWERRDEISAARRGN